MSPYFFVVKVKPLGQNSNFVHLSKLLKVYLTCTYQKRKAIKHFQRTECLVNLIGCILLSTNFKNNFKIEKNYNWENKNKPTDYFFHPVLLVSLSNGYVANKLKALVTTARCCLLIYPPWYISIHLYVLVPCCSCLSLFLEDSSNCNVDELIKLPFS